MSPASPAGLTPVLRDIFDLDVGILRITVEYRSGDVFYGGKNILTAGHCKQTIRPLYSLVDRRHPLLFNPIGYFAELCNSTQVYLKTVAERLKEIQ